MAILRLDQEVIEKLITTALAGVSGVTFIPRGRRQPAASEATAAKWCRLIRVACDGIGRAVIDGEPDKCDIVIVVNCYANAVATKLNAYAIQDCMNRVAAVLQTVRLVDSGPTHIVTTHEARTADDPEPSEDKAAQSGMVTVTAVGERVA